MDWWTCPNCGRKNISPCRDFKEWDLCNGTFSTKKYNNRPWKGCHYMRGFGELGPNGEILSKYKGDPNQIEVLPRNDVHYDSE